MKKSGGRKGGSSISNDSPLQKKPSLKEGLVVIGLLLLAVFLFDNFGKETITSATSSDKISGAVIKSQAGESGKVVSGKVVSDKLQVVGGNEITGANHVSITTQTGLEKFKIRMHDAFEIYSLSTKTVQDKKNLVTATENALEELYS